MVREIKARFTKGKIEPLEELELAEGEVITITVKELPAREEEGDPFEQAAGGWNGLVDTVALLQDFQKSRKIISPEVRL